MPFLGPQGYDFLGSIKLASANVSTGVLTIAARDILLVQSRVTGYSGGDIASLRFNGDSGANYWSRHQSIATAGTTHTDAPQASATLARLHPLTSTLQRSSLHSITNNLSTSKLGTVLAATSTGSAATVGILEFGAFEWVNTSAQITSIEMRTAGGSITLSAGTGFAVFGLNL
jgi:hypothetical protein